MCDMILFTVIIAFLMCIYLVISSVIITLFWKEFPKAMRITIIICILPMLLGIFGFIINSIKVWKQKQEKPKYELIQEQMYRKIN